MSRGLPFFLCLLVWLLSSTAVAEVPSSEPLGDVTVTAEEEMEQRFFIPIGSSPFLGNPNAPITIIEFSDFECPFSRRGNDTIKELLKTNTDIKVAFKHHPLPFHRNAPLAHKASIAAQNQERFWEYHDLLFENRKALKRPDLEIYAERLGLDMARFRRDIDSPETAAILAEDEKQAKRAGVRGTPQFFLNGSRLSGAQPLSRFQKELKKEMAIVIEYEKGGVPTRELYPAIAGDEPSFNPAPSKPKPAPSVPAKPIKVNITGSPFKGPSLAPITIVEFSDFACPFCQRVNPTIDEIMKEYPREVKVVFKQMPLVFHKHAALAAEASLAAHAQGKFWEYHDLLFSDRKALKRKDLEKHARTLGLDMVRFKGDLDRHTFLKVVEKDIAEAGRNGIRGTPNFVINGRKLTGAQPFSKFKVIIDEELKKAWK